MKYAVAVMHFCNNILKIEFVDANSWKEALANHSLMKLNQEFDNLAWLPNDMAEAQYEAYNVDFMFDVQRMKD